MAKRSCIFCGRTPTTKEHVVPRWVVALLMQNPKAANWTRPIEIKAWNEKTGVRRSWHSDNLDINAKCVCCQCNMGWMSQVESDAQPILTRLIAGQKTLLDLAAQKAIASWVALRSIVFRYTGASVFPVEQMWLQWFYEHRSPPLTCYQFIVAYEGNQPFEYFGNDIAATLDRSKEAYADLPDTPHGILMTLVIGYLAMKLLWVQHGHPTHTLPPELLQLWPPTEGVIVWPHGRVNDIGLSRLSRLFLD